MWFPYLCFPPLQNTLSNYAFFSPLMYLPISLSLFLLPTYLTISLSTTYFSTTSLLPGLVTSARSDARAHTLAHHKQPYAHPLPPLPTPTPLPSSPSSSVEGVDMDSIKTDSSSSSSSSGSGSSSSNSDSSSGSSSSEEVPSTLLACVERIKPTALIGDPP